MASATTSGPGPGPGPGSVTVTLRRSDATTDVIVADDGPGIAREHRERVFDRFIRLGGSDGPDGSGLGLAIVRPAAARLGATIDLSDVSRGTAVILRFPT